MSIQTIRFVKSDIIQWSMEGDANLSVQGGEISASEGELRWDCATELIRGEQPERATMTQ